MTIMVLELKVPLAPASPDGHEMVRLLFDQLSVFISYAASFLILAQLWMSHSTLTKNIEHIPSRTAQLNFLFLFFVCLVPFPTALLGEFGLRTGVIVLYAIILSCAATALGFVRLSVLTYESARKERLQLQRRRIVICLFVSLFGIAIALLGQISEWFLILSLMFVGGSSLAYRFIK